MVTVGFGSGSPVVSDREGETAMVLESYLFSFVLLLRSYRVFIPFYPILSDPCPLVRGGSRRKGRPHGGRRGRWRRIHLDESWIYICSSK